MWKSLLPKTVQPSLQHRLEWSLAKNAAQIDYSKVDPNWIKSFTKAVIPTDRLSFKALRSSGPGGQNVNKVSTKIEMRFKVADATWMPDYVRQQLAIQNAHRINKQGEMVVTSDRHRTQKQNHSECVEKLAEFIRQAGAIPRGPSDEKRERIAELKSASEARILEANRRRAAQRRRERSDGAWRK